MLYFKNTSLLLIESRPNLLLDCQKVFICILKINEFVLQMEYSWQMLSSHDFKYYVCNKKIND